MGRQIDRNGWAFVEGEQFVQVVSEEHGGTSDETTSAVPTLIARGLFRYRPGRKRRRLRSRRALFAPAACRYQCFSSLPGGPPLAGGAPLGAGGGVAGRATAAGAGAGAGACAICGGAGGGCGAAGGAGGAPRNTCAGGAGGEPTRSTGDANSAGP